MIVRPKIAINRHVIALNSVINNIMYYKALFLLVFTTVTISVTTKNRHV